MKTIALAITTVVCVISFYAAIFYGSYLAYQARHSYSNPALYTVMENTATIPQDWSTKPIVTLHVVPDATQADCPTGYENVFVSVWDGTRLACDCDKGTFTGEMGMFTPNMACQESLYGKD